MNIINKLFKSKIKLIPITWHITKDKLYKDSTTEYVGRVVMPNSKHHNIFRIIVKDNNILENNSDCIIKTPTIWLKSYDCKFEIGFFDNVYSAMERSNELHREFIFSCMK